MTILTTAILTILLPSRVLTNPNPDSSPNPGQQQYDWIVLTRLDLLGGVKLCDSSAAKKHGAVCLLPTGVTSIWEVMAAQRLDMIGARNAYRIEDRLMLGRRATMLKLEGAYAHYTSGKLHASSGSVNSGIAAARPKCPGSHSC